MTVSVLVPYTSDCPHRAAAWRWVRARYEALGWEIIEGACDGPWVKARAVEDAYQRSTGDILVVADADVWADTIPDAVATIGVGKTRWACPHGLVRRLTEQSTTRVLEGEAPDGLPLEQAAYTGRVAGGVVVVARDVWDEAPLDMRFVGWGQEDEAWAISLRAVAGRPKRLPGHLWHLWHPPQPRMSRAVGSRQSQLLFMRYCHQREQPLAITESREELARERRRRSLLHHEPFAAGRVADPDA